VGGSEDWRKTEEGRKRMKDTGAGMEERGKALAFHMFRKSINVIMLRLHGSMVRLHDFRVSFFDLQMNLNVSRVSLHVFGVSLHVSRVN